MKSISEFNWLDLLYAFRGSMVQRFRVDRKPACCDPGTGRFKLLIREL